MDKNTVANASDTLDPRMTISASSQTTAENLLAVFLRENRQRQMILNTTQVLISISHATGGHVRLEPDYKCVPVLIGSDQKPVPLFELVEALDEMIDYDSVRNDFPTLSYAQIDGAISFLRKVAQFNLLGIDLDGFDDQDITDDPALLKKLISASNRTEAFRVLGND